MNKHYKLVVFSILLTLGAITYSNSFSGSFHFDDDPILKNPALHNIMNLRGIWLFWPTRFLNYLSLAFNYQTGGENVLGYHALSFFIHFGTSLLLYWFISLIFKSPKVKYNKISIYSNKIAFFASAIFLVHPLCTEAVNYMTQRATSLGGFFYLLSICLYMKARLDKVERNQGLGRFILYAFSLVAAIASAFTKENSGTLPIAVFLCEACFFKNDKRIKWKYILPFLVTPLIISLLLFTTKPQTFQDIEKLHSRPAAGAHYFFTQLRVWVTYIKLSLVPLRQNLDYDYPLSRSLLEPSVLVSLIFLIGIFIFAILLLRKYRLLSFGILWFFLIPLPESSILPLGDYIFEHRLYLSMAGYSIFLVCCLFYLFRQKNPKVLNSLLVLLVIFYAALTYNRNKVWKDEVTLWNDVIKKSPHKPRPYINRAFGYIEKKEYDLALADLNTALRIDPTEKLAYNNRAAIYNIKNELDKAFGDLNLAVRIDPNYSGAYLNRALLYSRKGEFARAVSDLEQALRINPEYSQVYHTLGNTYVKMDKNKEAVEAYKKAIKIDSRNPVLYNDLAVAYGNLKDYQREVELCKKAIQLNPNYAQAYVNLGGAWGNMQDYEKVIENSKKAIEIDPNLALAHSNLAGAYFFKKEFPKAIKSYDRAIELGAKPDPHFLDLLKPYREKIRLKDDYTHWSEMIKAHPDNALAHFNLGTVFVDSGQLDDAIKQYETAIALDPKLFYAHINLGACLHAKGNFDEEAKEYRRAMAINPKLPEPYVNLGLLFIAKGQYKEAIDIFKEAIKVDSKCMPAYNGLGTAYIGVKNFAEAKKIWNLGTKINPAYQKIKSNLKKLEVLGY